MTGQAAGAATLDPAGGDPRGAVAANARLFEASAAFYDVQVAGRTADVEFYVEAAKELGGPVVEVGCGTGRVLAPIAAAGIPAVGVDHSAAMLTVARDRCGPAVALVHADLRTAHRNLAPARQVLFTFGVLQYVLQNPATVLADYARLLPDGGRLLVDVKAFLADPTYRAAFDRPVSRPTVTYPHPDGTVAVTTTISVDHTSQVVTEQARHTLTDPSGAELADVEHTHAMRVFTLPELVCLAGTAGLTVVDVRTAYTTAAATDAEAPPVGARYLLDLRP